MRGSTRKELLIGRRMGFERCTMCATLLDDLEILFLQRHLLCTRIHYTNIVSTRSGLVARVLVARVLVARVLDTSRSNSDQRSEQETLLIQFKPRTTPHKWI